MFLPCQERVPLADGKAVGGGQWCHFINTPHSPKTTFPCRSTYVCTVAGKQLYVSHPSCINMLRLQCNLFEKIFGHYKYNMYICNRCIKINVIYISLKHNYL